MSLLKTGIWNLKSFETDPYKHSNTFKLQKSFKSIGMIVLVPDGTGLIQLTPTLETSNL